MATKYKIKRSYVELGNFLANARRLVGLTQLEVSNELKYSSPQFISNFERGICYPPLKKLKKLVSIYKIDPNTVIGLIINAERKVITEGLKVGKA